MTSSDVPKQDLARDRARTAREGFTDAAQYLRTVPPEEWNGPTGCKKWTIRELAGHIVGEAVWFPNLVRGATREEAPLPMQVYEDLKTLPEEELTDRIDSAAAEIEFSIAEATPEQLEKTVDLGFAKMPVWQATYIAAFEGVFHNWDARAGRDPSSVILTPWALQLANGMVEAASMVARRDALSGAQGTYLLQVGDGVGPITVRARDAELSVEAGATGTPDVTLDLDADQYVRLIVGRFKLDSEQGREIHIDGDRGRAGGLNRIFAGIANEE
jgi:uncharacterized protein (TIGR03086 family)